MEPIMSHAIVFFVGVIIGRLFLKGPLIVIAKDISSGAFSVDHNHSVNNYGVPRDNK